MESIVLTALATSPEDRYQTAAQLHEELEEAIQVHDYKPTPGKLSRLMHQLFAEEIEEHEKKLREYHRERGEDTTIKSVPPPPMEGESQPRLAAGSRRGSHFGPEGIIDGEGRPGEAAPSRRRRVWIVAGLGAVAAIVAVLVFAFGSGESAPEGTGGPAPAIAGMRPAPEPSAATDEPAAQPEEPTEVRLDLGALPVGTVVTLDDETIGYPFVVPRSAQPGSLRITAPGYRAFEAAIPLDRDREVAVVLEKEGPRPRPGGQPRAGAEGRPGKVSGGKSEPSEKGVLLPSPFD